MVPTQINEILVHNQSIYQYQSISNKKLLLRFLKNCMRNSFTSRSQIFPEKDLRLKECDISLGEASKTFGSFLIVAAHWATHLSNKSPLIG